MSRPRRPRSVVWLNGRVRPTRSARISVLDRGLLYGDAAFETVRIYGGAPFRWADHRRRLATTLRRLRIPFPKFDLRGAIGELVAASGLAEAAIRLTVTRGEGEGLAPPPGLEPTVMLLPRPVPPGLDAAREAGVPVIRLPFGQGRHGFTSGHKTTDYAAAVQGRIRATEADAFEALYVEQDGALSEATTSNVFAVRRGELLTPALAEGCLPGITRQLVLDLARRANLEIRETTLRAKTLTRVQELFLTGSVIEIVPVVAVDGRAVGTGTPGPITRTLQEAYRRKVARHRKSS